MSLRRVVFWLSGVILFTAGPTLANSETSAFCEYELKFLVLDSEGPLPALRGFIWSGFIREPEDQSEAGYDLTGFWTKTKPSDKRIIRHPFKTIYQSVPRALRRHLYNQEEDLHLINGLNTLLQAKVGKRLGPIPILALTTVLSMPTWHLQGEGLQWAVDTGREGYVDARIVLDWKPWGDSVRYDYRQNIAKMDLANKEISPFKARKDAYEMNLAYADFLNLPKTLTARKTFNIKSSSTKTLLFFLMLIALKSTCWENRLFLRPCNQAK